MIGEDELISIGLKMRELAVQMNRQIEKDVGSLEKTIESAEQAGRLAQLRTRTMRELLKRSELGLFRLLWMLAVGSLAWLGCLVFILLT